MSIIRLVVVILAIAGSPPAARGDGLLRLSDCRISDDHGPIKAMGVNYVDGFWQFAKDGDRQRYLPYLDALAEAEVPFIRMAFGPWAEYRSDRPAAATIVDFVNHYERYFVRLDGFLADLKVRRIGVVLDVFWNADPYTTYFQEAVAASTDPTSRTFGFMKQIVSELGKRQGQNPGVWMLEYLNEGNLDIDFDRARHSRSEFVGQIESLVEASRAAGDKHLISSGNALPRPAAQHLDTREGWKPDTREEYLAALDAETPSGVDVASVHVYPEDTATRPWDGGDVFNALPAAVKHSRETCKPLFVGEYGAKDEVQRGVYIRRLILSQVQLAAIWGFGRPPFDPFSFGVDVRGRALLTQLGQQTSR